MLNWFVSLNVYIVMASFYRTVDCTGFNFPVLLALLTVHMYQFSVLSLIAVKCFPFQWNVALFWILII